MQPKLLLTERSGTAKITIVGCTMLAAVVLALVLAQANRSATVRTYFRAEQTLIEHWPERWGKSAVEQFAIHKLAPKLCRIGMLGPARIQVEPGISFLLNPRDLIAASILRGGEWQPEIWGAILPVLSEGDCFPRRRSAYRLFFDEGFSQGGKNGSNRSRTDSDAVGIRKL